MNLHPRINGTIALWQFQGDILDYSGNGYHLSCVNGTTHAPFPGLLFGKMSSQVNGVLFNDGCLQAVDLLDHDYGGGAGPYPVLMGPNVSALRLTGPMSVEWLMHQHGTYEGTYICCADPGGRSGGAAPDRIGSLYTLLSGLVSGAPAVTDQHIGSNLPSAGYEQFSGTSNTNWAGSGLPGIGDWSAHHFAYTRDSSGNWLVYRDGVVIGPGVLNAGANTSDGTERVFIGRCEGGGDGGVGFFASMRIVNYQRTAAQILADAQFTTGVCGAVPQPPVIDSSAAALQQASVVMAADVGRYYRLRPGHMPQLKG